MKLEITHDTIVPEAGRSGRPAKPFRLVLLADLHNASFDRIGSQVLQVVKEIQPAAVICAGDMLTAKGGRHGEDEAIRLLRALTQCCPIYMIQGNHELRMSSAPERERYAQAYEAYCRALESRQIHLLDNETVRLEISGMTLDLVGLTVPLSCYKRSGRQKLSVQDISRAVGQPRPDAYRVMIAHHPDFFPAYARWGADLVLSGHVHGGMVRLPLFGGVFGASLRPFPEYTKGMYRCGSGRMLLSAGLGAHTIPIRIGNPPHLAVIEFR